MADADCAEVTLEGLFGGFTSCFDGPVIAARPVSACICIPALGFGDAIGLLGWGSSAVGCLGLWLARGVGWTA